MQFNTILDFIYCVEISSKKNKSYITLTACYKEPLHADDSYYFSSTSLLMDR